MTYSDLPAGAQVISTPAAATGVMADLPDGATVLAEGVAKHGVLQPDGSFLVHTPTGMIRTDAQGNALGEDGKPAKFRTGATEDQQAIESKLAFVQGGSQHLVPIAAGVSHAIDKLGQGDTDVVGNFQRGRAGAQQETAQATAEHPGWEIAGNIATTLPAGGAGSAIERVGLNAGLSAIDTAAQGGNALEGAAIGAGAGVLGEAAGALANKIGSKFGARGAEFVTKQAERDTAAVEKEVASLQGKLGSEKQQASRLLENIQRGVSGVPEVGGPGAVAGAVRSEAAAALSSPAGRELAEGVLQRNLEDLPGKLASVKALEQEFAEASANKLATAQKRTAEYFAQPLWSTEILPRIKTLAPRFGMGAAAYLAGAAFDGMEGEGSMGRGTGAAFGLGTVLAAPGVRQMLKNVMASPRIQVAVSNKLMGLFGTMARGAIAGLPVVARELGERTLTDAALGPPQLAAEQLAARGGLASVIGRHEAALPLQGPSTPLDKAIQQTAAVTAMAGAIDAHHGEIETHIEKVIKGDKAPHSSIDAAHATQDFGGKRMSREADDAHTQKATDAQNLAANPQAMLDRLSNNLGEMHAVAPNVAQSMSGVAERAVGYLAKAGARPSKTGPLQRDHAPSATERLHFAQKSEVVENPETVFKHAAAGTLTGVHMEALREVYPMLARHISDKVLERIIEQPEVAYRQRLMLGLLSGIDPDGTLKSIGPNQAAIQAPSRKTGGMAPATRGGGDKAADKLTLAQRTATGTQNREEKERTS